VALVIKLGCAAAGIGLGLFSLSIAWEGRRRVLLWRTQAGCAIAALSAAGVLRWFS